MGISKKYKIMRFWANFRDLFVKDDETLDPIFLHEIKIANLIETLNLRKGEGYWRCRHDGY